MYELIVAFLLGAISIIVIRPALSKVTRKFRSKAPLIRRYWRIVIPFSLLTALAYILVAFYANNQLNFEILGQVSSLLFAIFVGYIAFSEWSGNKFDDLKSKAMTSLNNDNLDTALKQYEDAHSLQPKEEHVLANMIELYLIKGRIDEFDSKIDLYKSSIIEPKDNLSYYFLKALRQLIVENIGEAKTVINETITFVSNNKDLMQRFNWRLKELHSSDIYKGLTAPTKKMVNNLHAYLGGKLNSETEAEFIKGNYDTENIEPTTKHKSSSKVDKPK